MLYMVNNETKEHRLAERNYTTAGGVDVRSIEPLDTGWRYVQADADGWIKWEGGECPLPQSAECQVIMYDNFDGGGLFAPSRSWVWEKPAGITHYRPILEDRGDECSNEMSCEGVAQEWDGAGLPPVGVRVEVNCEEEAEVVGFYDGCVVFVFTETGIADMEPLHNLSPIRSEEDRAVEEIQRVVREATGAGCSGRMARALFMAGYRKTNTNEEK